jgi:hypothetical protein
MRSPPFTIIENCDRVCKFLINYDELTQSRKAGLRKSILKHGMNVYGVHDLLLHSMG